MSDINKLEQEDQLADGEMFAADVSARVPEKWGKEIESRAEPRKIFKNYIKVNTDLVGTSGNSIKLPKRPILDYATFAPTETGGDENAITPNAELSYETVELYPDEKAIGGSMSKQAIEEAMVSVLDDLVTEMARAVAQREDLDIIAALTKPDDDGGFKYIEADASGSYTTGDWDTSKADGDQSNITEDDVIDLGVISYASDILFPEAGFEADVLFIHPRQKAALMRDDHFLDASKAGDNRMLRRGVIGQIFGLDVVVSKNLPTLNILSDGTGTGYQAIMMDTSAGGAIAYKRPVTVESKYEPMERKYYTAITSVYQCKRLNNGAVVVVNTA